MEEREMLKGYTGKIASVNLSTREIDTIRLEDSMATRFIGGYGLGAKLLYDLQKPGLDPLEPDSILGFMTGPLTGTPAVTGSRFAVVGKSPLTRTWSDSNCGGHFGPALKRAGFDGILFRGVASSPVYLLMEEEKVNILDAGDLWGKSTSETERFLKSRFGTEVQVASIGRAGEKQVLIANIINDGGRAAGRSGFGALMGSKRLKAIVAKGNREVALAHPEKMAELRKDAISDMKKGKGLFEAFRGGSAAYTPMAIATGDAPTKNWSGVGSEDFPQGANWQEEEIYKYRVKKYGCWKCPIACGGLVRMESETYGLLESHQPEYETMAAFTGNCLNDNLESVVRVDNLCNNDGIDTISAGGLVAFLINCYEAGLITTEDTDGLEMRWGNHEAIVQMTEKIATREGIGDILAQGFEAATKHIGKGAARYAIHLRGEALPMHDPRFEPALGLIYKVNASPAKHLPASQYFKPPGLDLEIPEFGAERQKQIERVRGVRILECLNNAMSSLGLCVRGYLSFDVHFLPAFLGAATGREWTLEEMIEVGERIANVRQAFNAREGINLVEQGFPPIPLGRPPLTAGPLKDVTVNLETMMDAYFHEMKWDRQNGKPSRAKLKDLGLDDIANDLYPV
jgi:aldehyde:ferredoxin oxidoreductase